MNNEKLKTKSEKKRGAGGEGLEEHLRMLGSEH
jgi:hypothetical protein